MKPLPASFPSAIGWLIISTVLLTLPGSAFPQENWLDKIWTDKWIHIGMFSLLVVLWCISWRALKKDASPGTLKKLFIVIGLIGTCYGVAMEFVQLYFIAHRSFDVGDIIADAVGSAAGVIFSIRRYIKK